MRQAALRVEDLGYMSEGDRESHIGEALFETEFNGLVNGDHAGNESILHPPILSSVAEGRGNNEGKYGKDILKKIFIVQKDISTVPVDVVINATNRQLDPRAGVDGALQRRGGPRLRAACRDIGYCPLGGAVITKGFNLPAKLVIHTTGPTDKEPISKLVDCYVAIFDLVKRYNAYTVAIPCVSTGAFHVDSETACKIAITCVLEALAKNPAIKRVYFVMLPRDHKNIS